MCSVQSFEVQNHYLEAKYNVCYCLCLMPQPFSPLLFSPCPCLGGELTAVASSRVCLVAAGFGCQVLGYHAHRGIWVCDRLWQCTACSCEAPWGGVRSSCLLYGRALADHLPLSVPTASQCGIRNPLWPLWVGSDAPTLFCLCSIAPLKLSHTRNDITSRTCTSSASLLSAGSEQILQEMLNAQIYSNQDKVSSRGLLNLF